IELVLSEMAEQVAIRLRRAHKKASKVSIHVSYSRTEMKKAIQGQVKIDPSNSTRILTQAVLTLFRDRYTSGAVRRIG
ncbi:DinB/UmuC family translesion DNA polymerase, partial [Streptococcus pyogenes]